MDGALRIKDDGELCANGVIGVKQFGIGTTGIVNAMIFEGSEGHKEHLSMWTLNSSTGKGPPLVQFLCGLQMT